MATIQASPEQLFEIIEDLRLQRNKADQIVAGPFQAGAADLWERRTVDLIRQALDERHYDVETFHRAGAGSYLMIPDSDDETKEAVRLENVRRFVAPHIPPLDDAIAEAEKKLARLTGAAVPRGPIAPPASALPRLDFSFMNDPALRAIAQRDYGELRVAAHYQNDKSKAILSGAVIETVVLDLLLQRSIPFTELKGLTAHGLYERAKKERLIGGRQSSAVDASRDTRNFVHPAVEYREGPLTREQADLALSLMKAILGELGVVPT
jgi:hypothetical protein